jgi:hypothetical protein
VLYLLSLSVNWKVKTWKKRKWPDWDIIPAFLFLGSASCCVYYQGYYKCCPSQQLYKMFIPIYLLPLHVLALVGHLQVEYTIFAGSYCTYNGSIVLCALVSVSDGQQGLKHVAVANI